MKCRNVLLKDFFKENIGKAVTQIGTFLPEEKMKQLLKEKIGPIVMQLSPKYGEVIMGILMSFDLTKLAPLAEDQEKLKETVKEEEKKLEENEKRKQEKHHKM